MSLAALIAAERESEEEGRPLRALLPLAGRSLVERQARLAAAAGASPVVLLADQLPPDLSEAVERLRRDRIELVVARGADEAAEAVDRYERLLVVGDGFIADAALFARFAALPGRAVLTVPEDAGGDARYERIDARERWAGLMLADGALLRETAAMLSDWDLVSTLLRRTIQAGARHVPAAGEAAVAERRADLDALQRRILAEAGRGAGGTFIDRWLLAPLERVATGWLLAGKAGPRSLAFAAFALTASAAAAWAWPRFGPWPGLVLLLLAAPLEGMGERLARVRMQEGIGEGWSSHLIPAAAAAALLALGAALSPAHGWGMGLLALTCLLFLLAAGLERDGKPVAGEAWLAERRAMPFLLLPFAAFGQWAAGLIFLFAWSAASFFWAQREAHRFGRGPDG